MLTAPDRITTARLVLRRPTEADAPAVYAYGSDDEAVRYVGFPRHLTVEDSRRWLVDRAITGWERDGVGAYLVERDGEVIGAGGLHPLAPHRAFIGYIFARGAWGKGYATETARALVSLGRSLRLARIEATCHVDHDASARVLEKAGMTLEAILRRYSVLPNCSPLPQDVRCYIAP